MVTGQSYWCGKAAMILLGCSCCTDFPGQQDVLQAEFFLFHQTAPCKAQVGIKTKLSKSEKAPWKCMGRKNNLKIWTLHLGLSFSWQMPLKSQDNIPEKSEDLRTLVNWFLPSNTGFIIPGQICSFYHYMWLLSHQINISNICKVLWDSARKC